MLLIFTLILLAAATLVYIERKFSAFIQNRIGPNRAGPKGLLQPFADVLKLFMKEDIVPDAANKHLHRLAPSIWPSVFSEVGGGARLLSILWAGSAVFNRAVDP